MTSEDIQKRIDSIPPDRREEVETWREMVRYLVEVLRRSEVAERRARLYALVTALIVSTMCALTLLSVRASMTVVKESADAVAKKTDEVSTMIEKATAAQTTRSAAESAKRVAAETASPSATAAAVKLEAKALEREIEAVQAVAPDPVITEQLKKAKAAPASVLKNGAGQP